MREGEGRTLQPKQLPLLPRHIPDPRRIRRDVEDHAEQHHRAPAPRVRRPVLKVPARALREVVERDGRERQAKDHAGCGDEHDAPAADDVDVLERDEREDEIRAGDDEADGGGLVEAHLGEERGGEVPGRG